MFRMSLTRRQFHRVASAALVGATPAIHAQDDRIVLGQSAAFTGPAAQLGIQFHAGAKLFFDQLNAQGGAGGRRVEIRQLDDGYEPDRCAADTQKLIGEDVFALFGYIGTPTSVAQLTEHCLIGFDQPTPFIREVAKSMRGLDRESFSLRADSSVAQLALIRCGAGIGF